jgi:hypothetical protein
MRPPHLSLLLTLPFAFVLLGCRTRGVSDDAGSLALDDGGAPTHRSSSPTQAPSTPAPRPSAAQSTCSS